MLLLQIVRLRLRTLLSRGSADRELDEELAYHLHRLIEQNLAAGMSQDEARLAARRLMAGMEQRKEECRDWRGLRWLQDLGQDTAYGIRTLSKTPAFTLVAALVLALAIGVNTAVFTVVNGVLLRPLPFQQADRLVLVSSVPKSLIFDPGPIMVDRDYAEFRQHNHSFESIAALGNASGMKMTLTRHGEPAVVSASVVGPDFLRVLKVDPALGRGFLPNEHGQEVLLSNRMWRERFAADASAIGKAVTLEGVSYNVVGVMPSTFSFQNADLWVRDEMRGDAHNIFFLPVVGRLRPGVSPQQAQAELTTFTASLPPNSEFGRSGMVNRIIPLRDLFVANVRKLLLIFSGAAGFVFLIACANFANLLLIRGAGRQPEIAVRAALGASRWRLVRQLMAESTLLSLMGSVVGVALSVAGVRALVALIPPENIPPGSGTHVDVWVLLFAISLAVVTGVVFGLAPAIQSTRRELREGINEGGRSVLVKHERLRGALVIAEIALALVLLTGAGLLVRSFLQMRSVDTGFRADNLTVSTVDFPRSRYTSTTQLQEFDQRVLKDLAALPGAESVAAVSFLPFGHGVMGDFQVEDGRHLPDDFRVDKPEVSSAYFRTMGIRIVSGRGFTGHDVSGAPGVAVVSESVARLLWPNGNAVGKRISMDDHPKAGDWLAIVGVAADVRQEGITDKQGAVIYQPYQQITMPGFIQSMSFVVKSKSPQTAATGMRAVIRRMDGDLPTESVTTMQSIVAASMTGTKSQTRLLAIFSVVALVLAAIGVYGVLACSVAERTHEIGIRMAVGAERTDIVWMVMRRSLVLTGGGVFLGALGALGVTRVLMKFLFEVTPTDPVTFGAVTGILIAVALIAAWIPARRAAAVYPLEALRHS
jgi:putative ABC transport system permease protein